MTIQNFSMVAGNSKTIVATVDGATTLSNVQFVVKKNEIVVLTKDNLPVSGNVLTLTILPVDTQSLAGEYDYEMIHVDEYHNVITLFSGKFSFNKGGGVTAQQVFITAMDMMDEESEDGTFDGYPREYKRKSWNVLSLLQAELTPANVTPALITDESSVFYLDDRTALTVLPYGLAAHLLLNEDQNRASFFNARYDELKRKRPATITKIKDVYGVAPSEESVTSVTVNIDGLDTSWGDIDTTWG